MRARIRAHATLIGTCFDINAVTQKMQITPDWIKNRDEVLKPGGHVSGHDEWGVETAWYDLDDDKVSFEIVVKELLMLLPQDASLLRVVSKKFNAEWHILFDLDVYEDFPAIVFDNDFLSFAAEMGAEIGFDVFNYQE